MSSLRRNSLGRTFFSISIFCLVIVIILFGKPLLAPIALSCILAFVLTPLVRGLAKVGSASDDRWMMRNGGKKFWASGITSAVKDARVPNKEWPVCDRTFQVLVVEDMRALRVIMSRLLEKLGHRVQVAEDRLAALESITQVTPDVIFSDISMPGMTGYDLARKIRGLPNASGIYLVAMSGYGQLADRKMSKESGFDEHMVKPVDIEKLRDLFERLSRDPNHLVAQHG